MKDTLTITYPLDDRYDVIVCGGGPAGCAAALSAARNGARVALIEQMGYLGGTGTVNGVNVFSPGYHDGEREIMGGIFKEVYRLLLDKDALIPHVQHAWEPFNMEVYKRIWDDLLFEAGVDVFLESAIVAAKTTGGHIDNIMISCLQGLRGMQAKTYIDCTGDGHLSMLAGASFECGRDEDGAVQPYTMMFFVGGVDIDKIKGYSRDNICETPDGRSFINGNGFRPFIEKANAEGLNFIPKKTIGSMYNIPWLPGVVGINFGRVFGDGTLDPKQLFLDTRTGRLQVEEAMKILKGYLPGFENCYLIESTAKIGRRESRRIKGLYTMTVEDVLEQRQFDDVIAQGCYQVDIHGLKDASFKIVKLPPKTHYDIPFSILVPQDVDNLLVAGRCVSATHEGLGAIRVQPICMAMGQAVGTAAALCRQADCLPKQLSVAKLQSVLESQGVILH